MKLKSMKLQLMKIKFLFLTFLLFLLFGCSLNNPKLITLSTDSAVFSAYIEYYNSIITTYKIQMVYNDNPMSNFQDNKYNPDIMIYENLPAFEASESFEPLNKFLKSDIIPPEAFYSSLLETAFYKKKCVALPLSFSLPMVIFNNKYKDTDIVSLILPLEILKTKTMKFNILNNKKSGFSPFWNDDFIFSTAMLFGADFRLENNKLTWNKKALYDSVNFFKTWFTDVNSGYEAEQHFSGKYLNIPPYKLIEQERILYYFTSSEYLYSIPKEKRKNIEFRWLSSSHKIPVNDNVTYIGIPGNAKHKKEAGEFLKWLFTPVVQACLLKMNNYKQISGIFGIANKFSALAEVNEKYIPQYSPLMVGHIPEKEFLTFPGQLPGNWKKTKEQIIKNWMIDVITSNESTKNLESLINF